MKAQIIRCQSDLEYYNKLTNNQYVKKANEAILEQKKNRPTGLRRRLLSTSVRLSRVIAPEIHRMADNCIEILEVNTSLELYVFPSSDFNAICFKPEDGRLFIMFSSSLLEAFSEAELGFVIGHEMGHHIYGHHDIPIGYLLQTNTNLDPRLVLELFAWSRYAEISADRAGAHCANNLHSVAKSLFKMASGLSGKVIQFNLDEFLNQIDDMVSEDDEPGINSPKEDWFSSHPFSPLRVKALKLFDESEYQKKGGISKADLEIGVQSLMSFMEPSYIEGKTDTATHMRRLLYAGAIAVANSCDSISNEEIAIFEKFFGTGELSTSLDIPRIIEDLPNRAQKSLENTSILQRMQVLRDLCLVAKASGEITQAELEVLEDIASQISISPSFLHQTIEQQVEQTV